MALEPPCELCRGLRLPVHTLLECLESAQQQRARVRRRDDARTGSELLQPLGVVLAFAYDGPEQHIVMAAEVFGRAVQYDAGTVLERPQMDQPRGGRVDDEAGRM